jgi:CheY-like chemotaxis protein
MILLLSNLVLSKHLNIIAFFKPNMKILLADDNSTYGRFFSNVLQEKGHQVDYVCNKVKLVERAKKVVMI